MKNKKFESIIDINIILNQGEAFISNAYIWKIDKNGETVSDDPFLKGKFKTVGNAVDWLGNFYPILDCDGFRLLVAINDDEEEIAVEYFFNKSNA
jgi:hypothetical protein